jgi:hypothetical protein
MAGRDSWSKITCARAARTNDSKYLPSELGDYVVLAKRHFQYRTIVGRRRAIQVLERAIANLGDSRALAITRPTRKSTSRSREAVSCCRRVSKTFMAGNATLVLSPSNVAIPCSYTARLIQVEAKPKTLLSLPDRDCVYFAAVSEGDFTQRKPR